MTIAPLVVTECPWGDASERATYEQFDLFSEEIGHLWKAFQHAIKDAPEKVTLASFNLSKMQASEFDTLVDEIGGVKVDVIANLLSKYVAACPEVRDVRDPEAYLDLPYYTQFRPLANKLSTSGKEQMENFLKRFAAS